MLPDNGLPTGHLGGWMVGSFILFLTASPLRAQEPTAALIVPGSMYFADEVPDDATTGHWWRLYYDGSTVRLERTSLIRVPRPACGDSGRGVEFLSPDDSGGLVFLRGLRGLRAGVVRTVFRDDGAGDASEVSTAWHGSRLVISHVVGSGIPGGPGDHQAVVTVGEAKGVMLSGQWHGDGHWRVHWIGDLEPDGHLEVLFDFSGKYSVHATYLFSLSPGPEPGSTERARVTHVAC